MPRRWMDYLYRHAVVTFVLTGAFFLLFGVTSVSLFVLLKMNIGLFINYGFDVIEDGALAQLVQLVVSAIVSVGSFVMFSICERTLVKRLLSQRFGARQ